MYATQMAIQVAFAVYRNTGEYRRSAETMSNSKQIKQFLKGRLDLDCTELDINNAQELQTFAHRYVLALLDQEETFITKTYKIMNDPTCTDRELGLIAYLPVFYFKEQDTVQFRKDFKHRFENSDHIHERPFRGTVEIVRVLDTSTVPIYYADYHGNLLSFFHGDATYQVGDVIQIKSARIKNHIKSIQIPNTPETQLSHIRVTS